MNKFLLSLFVLFLSFSATAQIDEKEKLEQRKEQLQRELSEAKTKLQNEKKKEKSVLKEIAGQDAQIKISEKIISTIAKQARILDDNIYLTQLEINKLNKDLKIFVENYINDIIEEAVECKIPIIEIIPGKGSGQLKKKVIRFLEQS